MPQKCNCAFHRELIPANVVRVEGEDTRSWREGTEMEHGYQKERKERDGEKWRYGKEDCGSGLCSLLNLPETLD